MPQGYDARVHPDAQGWESWAGFRRDRQAGFLGRLFVASDQAPAQRGPLVRPRQSRQEFEQRLLRDLAASALHAGEARQPPARAEAQRLGLKGPVAREAATQRQDRQTRGTFRRRRRRHRLAAGTRHRRFCHLAGPAGGEKRRGPLNFLLQLTSSNRRYRGDGGPHDSRRGT